jgi:hypothetical protein
VYTFQHLEPIQYVDGLFKSLPIFLVNDPKVTIDLDDFPFVSKLVVQQPPIQIIALTTLFIGMKILIMH